ncbi:hypothetical protein [Streptomyces sp. NPDC059708]|uniref:hypothetical protein n=1 Tax=Streptomyces sp. NPDC059708 TaxID=3346916 RepID=UPI0036B1248A
MYENAQERPPAPVPPTAGITDGVVELRKRRPSAPAEADEDGRSPDTGAGQDI